VSYSGTSYDVPTKKIKKPLHPPQKNEKMFETPKPKGAAGPHLIEGMLGYGVKTTNIHHP